MDTLQAHEPGSEEPLYLVVYGALRDALTHGEWEVGASLPSEADLSGRFQVSRITVRHALRLLETEGYIRKARARRPVVVRTTEPPTRGWLLESLDDIVAMVADAQLRVGSWRRETSQAEARLLEVPAGAKLHCLRSTLTRNGKAYARSIIYFPPMIGARLARKVFDDTVIFRVVQRELGISLADVQMTIWAEPANRQDAAELCCDPGAPLLVTRLLYHDASDVPVELAYSRSLASEARLSTRLRSSHSGA